MINVFFNIDEGYIPKCKTIIRSILANTKADVCFYIIGVKNFKINGVKTVCFDKPDISILTHTVQIAHITMASTFRLFAPLILPCDKVIYLDSDLIVLDDIAELWSYEPEYIAGVPDPMYRYQAKKNHLKHLYINTGVMVMNLKNLCKLNYMERIEETQNGGYNLSLLDQDIINIALGDKIEHLPYKWNVFSKIYPETTYAMIEARNNPSIIHWCGRDKPWNNLNVWQAEKWSEYDNL